MDQSTWQECMKILTKIVIFILICMILTKMMMIMIFDADADESIEINYKNW